MGAVLSRAFLLLTVPLVAQNFAPELFGYWPIILAVATVAAPLALLRYDIAVPLEADDDSARALLAVMLLATAFLTGLLTIVCMLTPNLVLIGGAAQLPTHVRLAAPIYLFATSITAIASAWLVRQRHYLALSLSNSALGVTTLGGALLFPYIWGPSIEALFGTFIFGVIVGMIVAVGAAIRAGALRNPYIAVSRMIISAKAYRVYPIYSTPYSLSAVAFDRGIQFILSTAYGLSSLGLFYLVRQILFLPVNVCTTALRQVVFGYTASSGNMATRKQIIGSVAKPLFLVVPFASGFAEYTLHHQIALLLGENWMAAADLVPPMVLHAGTLTITAWLDRVFDLFGRQRLSVALQIGSDFLQLALAFALAAYGFAFIEFVWAVSMFAGAYNLLWLFIALRVAGFDWAVTALWLAGVVAFALIGIALGVTVARYI